MCEFAGGKMRKGFVFLNSARDLRARAVEKNAPKGSAPWRSFRYYTILSRAVLSQSTQPAKPIGFLIRVAEPLALSGATPSRNPSSFDNPFCIHASFNAFVGEGASLTFTMVGEVGADPITLFRGTVLQTAEFADSLYSPIFRGTGCALTIPTGASVRLSARVVALYRGCPSLCFYYSTLLAICQALFLPSLIFFREDTWREPRGSFSYQVGFRRIGVPLLRNWQGVFCRVSFP